MGEGTYGAELGDGESHIHYTWRRFRFFQRLDARDAVNLLVSPLRERMTKEYVLGEPRLNLGDVRDVGRVAERIPALQEDVPARYRLSIVARRSIIY